MSVHFSIVRRQNPVNRAVEKFYPQAKVTGSVTLDTLSRRISRATSASRGDVQLVLISMVDEIIESLEEGNSVNLGELGTMRIGLRCTGESSEKAVSASNVLSSHILFTPTVALKDRLKRISFRPIVKNVCTTCEEAADNGVQSGPATEI